MTTMFDHHDDADDSLGAVEGRRRHCNRGKRTTTQTIQLQEDDQE